MSTRKVVRAIFVCLSMAFLTPAFSIAGETINFGIGKMLDPSLNPDQCSMGIYSQDKPTLLRSQDETYCVWVEKSDCDDQDTDPSYRERYAISRSLDNGITWEAKDTCLPSKVNNFHTIAGTGTAGYSGDGGPADQAMLNNPQAAVQNGELFILDSANHRVRHVDNSGIITTIAGNGTPGYSGDGGPAIDAQLNYPMSFVYGAYGHMYIADYGNNRIRAINSFGNITTIAGDGEPGYYGDGGLAVNATLNGPTALYYVSYDYSTSNSCNNLYICDSGNRRIRKIDLDTGIIATVAGGGSNKGDGVPATEADMLPVGIAMDCYYGDIYVSDQSTSRVRKIDPVTGLITTVAGKGLSGPYNGDGIPATAAYLSDVHGITLTGQTLLIADTGHGRVRRVDLISGIIVTVAGNGSYGSSGGSGLHADEVSLKSPVWAGENNHYGFIIIDAEDSRVMNVNFIGNGSYGGTYGAVADSNKAVHLVATQMENLYGGLAYAKYENGTFVESSTLDTDKQYSQISTALSPDENTLYVMTNTMTDGIFLYSYDLTSGTWQDDYANPIKQTGGDFEFCVDGTGKLYLFAYNGLYVDDLQGYGWNYHYNLPPNICLGDSADVGISPDGKVGLLWDDGGQGVNRLYFALFEEGFGFPNPVIVHAGKEERRYHYLTYGGLNQNNEYNVYAVWYEERYPRIYGCYEFDFATVSTDGGKSFSKDFRANWGDYNAECAQYPKVLVQRDAGGVERLLHVWEDDRNYVIPGLPHRHQLYTAQGRLYDRDADVLVVDDDNSGTPVMELDYYLNYPEFRNYYNYEAWYVDALFNLGIPHDFYDAAGEQHMPSLDYLKRYKTVVWETGMEYNDAPDDNPDDMHDKDDPATLSADEQVLLKDYLDWGGKLFLCSQDFLRDVTDGMDGQVSNPFANEYLSVSGVQNYFDQCNTYTGVSGDPIGDGLSVRTTDSIWYTNPVTGIEYDHMFFQLINTDSLTLAPDSKGFSPSVIFTFNGGDIAIRKSADPYSLVFMTFPFETVNQYEPYEYTSREELMSKVTGWLDGAQGMYLSKNADGSTQDKFFNSSDTVYVFAWSDRLRMNTLRTAEAVLLDGKGIPHNVALNYDNSTGMAVGSLPLSGLSAGDWVVDSLSLLDNKGATYGIVDRPFNVSLELKADGPARDKLGVDSVFPVAFRVKDETGGLVTVTVRYHNVLDPQSSEDVGTVVLDTSAGEATGVVDFRPYDFGVSAGDELAIDIVATAGGTTVNAAAPGTLLVK